MCVFSFFLFVAITQIYAIYWRSFWSFSYTCLLCKSLWKCIRNICGMYVASWMMYLKVVWVKWRELGIMNLASHVASQFWFYPGTVECSMHSLHVHCCDWAHVYIVEECTALTGPTCCLVTCHTLSSSRSRSGSCDRLALTHISQPLPCT